jgi:hypothetical protein
MPFGWREDEHNEPLSGALLLIFALLVLWIPLRAYADWYQNAFLGVLPVNNELVLASILSVAFGLFLLYFYLIARLPADWTSLLSFIIGFIGPVVGFLLYVYPTLFEQINIWVNSLSMPGRVIVGLFLLLSIPAVSLDIIKRNT